MDGLPPAVKKAWVPWLILLLALSRFTCGVDESLYSRQLYVLGMPAQQRLAESNVLIVGLGGVGVEIAKNLILTGPRSVTIIDPTPARVADLSCQYYLREESVGKPRAQACVARLQELNPHVQVEALKVEGADVASIEAAVKATGLRYDVIVAADQDHDAQEKLNELARRLGARFVSAEARGLCGSLFTDCGDDFTVVDRDGREPANGVIARIVQEQNATVVRLVDGQKHDLQVGDVVGLEGVSASPPGGERLGEQGWRVTKVVNSTTFHLEDTAHVATVLPHSQGTFRQIKQPVTLHFLPLSSAKVKLPGVPTDFGKASADHQATLLSCFATLPAFVQERKRMPTPGSKQDAHRFLELVRKCSLAGSLSKEQGLKKPLKLEERLVRRFARTCSGMVGPVCSFIGGSAAQEVVKACTGHSLPLQQMLFFDALEALPWPLPPPIVEESGHKDKKKKKKGAKEVPLTEEEEDAALPTEEDCKPLGDRYDGLRAVFGAELVGRVQQLKVFVVGAGAIGCELLKNLALLGLGDVTVTDNDTIEKSNLNRQFLFREKDIGSPKSEAAARAVRGINRDMAVTPLTRKVGRESENVFDDDFWAEQDVILNGLDNVAARLYVDGRCVYYRKPLLESGTEGTSGNVQVIVPYLTESYGSSVDPPEASIPVCTLKSFPYRIEHTIQWARDYFDGFFRIQPERLNDLVDKLSALGEGDSKGAASVLADMRALASDEMVLRDLEQALGDLEILDPMPSFRKCVRWALDRFYELYDVNIRALLREHPLDSKGEEGEPFWTGDRKMPTPAAFDPRNRLHVDFLLSATLLKARVLNVLDSRKSAEDIEQMALSVVSEILPGYKPMDPPATCNDPAELEARLRRELEEVRAVVGRVASRASGDKAANTKCASRLMLPETFEKDQDANGHMAFITAASNLRAINYGIAPADRLQTKKIAGRIIPAISTTTSVVAGLASLELFKLAQADRVPLSAYRNAFINLAGPFFALTEPYEAAPVALGENGKVYTMWDRLELRPRRDLTLRQFLAQTLKQYGIRVSSIMIHGSKILYADFLHNDGDPVLDTTITELVKSVEGPKEGDEGEGGGARKFVDLEVECADEEEEEMDSPPVRYFFPAKRPKGRWGGWFKAVTQKVSGI